MNSYRHMGFQRYIRPVLFILFAVTTILFFINIISIVKGVEIENSKAFYLLIRFFPAALVVVHAIYLLGRKRAATFLGISFLVGFVMEYIGLSRGIIFGGEYTYRAYSLMLGLVPLVVPIFWMVFIYTAYSVTNYLLFNAGIQKPSFRRGIVPLVGASIIDGLIVTSLDVLLDPFEVARGSWTWLSGGPWYGTPVGNYIGWFLVAFMSSLVFRFIEYRGRPQYFSQDERVIYRYPLLGYCVIMIKYIIGVMAIGYLELGFLGILFIAPFFVPLLIKQKNNPRG